jgi:hypothetical protein
VLLLGVVASELWDPRDAVVRGELLGELGFARRLGAGNDDPR